MKRKYEVTTENILWSMICVVFAIVSIVSFKSTGCLKPFDMQEVCGAVVEYYLMALVAFLLLLPATLVYQVIRNSFHKDQEESDFQS